MRFDVRGVDHLRIHCASLPGEFSEQVFPDPTSRPAYKAIVDRRRWTILWWTIAPAAPTFQHMNDATDDAAIICTLDTPNIRRQMRLDPPPLFVAQPKEILAHDPSPFQKRIRIVLSAQRN
jgi:hypothetical protein